MSIKVVEDIDEEGVGFLVRNPLFADMLRFVVSTEIAVKDQIPAPKLEASIFCTVSSVMQGVISGAQVQRSPIWEVRLSEIANVYVNRLSK